MKCFVAAAEFGTHADPIGWSCAGAMEFASRELAANFSTIGDCIEIEIITFDTRAIILSVFQVGPGADRR